MNRKTIKIFMSLLALALLGSCNTKSYLSLEDPDVIFKRAMEFCENEQWAKATRYFDNIASSFIGTPRADSVFFFSSKSRFKDRDYYSAITYFENYRHKFSRSPFLEDAEGMLTLSYYYISPGPERDAKNIAQALSSIAEFQSRYPESKQRDTFEEIRLELMGRLHDKSYLNAYTYYKIGQHKAAIVAFKNALKEYPESKNREKIMYYMLSSSYELASNSVAAKEVDRHMAVVDTYYSFVAEFPDSEFKKSADGMVAKSRAFLEKSNPDLLK